MMRPRPAAPEPRRGVILIVVLLLLTLFAIVGLSFVLYAESSATSSRISREAQTQGRPDMEPELLFAYFMGQLVYDAPDDEKGVSSGLRGHSLARTMYGRNYGFDAGLNVVEGANDVPYNGLGRYHTVAPPTGRGPEAGTFNNPFNEDDHNLINYTFFARDGFLRDPERLGALKLENDLPPVYLPWRTDPADRSVVPGVYYGGANAPYTYPDLNSLFLAVVKAGSFVDGSVRVPEGAVLTQSFHRPWLFGSLTDVPRPGVPGSGNPNWTNAVGKYRTLRPRPIDMGPGFPYPEDEGGDVKNLPGGPGFYDARFTRRLHNNDSLWMDLGAPVMVAPDGRKFKPLFAPLIVDLDGRVNLNLHGNVRGVVFNGRTGQPVPDPATGQPVPNHVSNQGWGPWEVNVAKVLNRNRDEWKNLFHGATGQRGRYGEDRWPHGLGAFFAPAPHFYAPVDLDSAREATTFGPTDQIRLPGIQPSQPYQPFPTLPAGYGNASAQEQARHPSRFNPFSPVNPDRAYALSNLEALLRHGDTGSEALASELMRLCPLNFADAADPGGSARRRHLVTVRSFDVDRPGAAPWFWTPDGGDYLRVASTTSAVPAAAGPLASPRAPGLPLQLPDSEFGPDGRAAAALTALRRLDLNRYLPPYPAPDPATRRIRPADEPQFAVAQQARQHFAAEVFERLWRVTGAGNPFDVRSLPPPGFPGHSFVEKRWEALRRLAQLAVNVVDFIDNDNYMTPFQWYPSLPLPGNPLGEWVFGTELPQVVLNEAYVEYGNDPADPGLARTPPVATRLKSNVWAELYNTFREDPGATTPSRTGEADLEIPAAYGERAYGAYRLVIAKLASNLRQPDNVRGLVLLRENGDEERSALTSFTPEPGGPADPGLNTAVILPDVAGAYAGIEGGNKPFYVVGPRLAEGERDPFGGRLTPTLRRSEMSYLIPAVNPSVTRPFSPGLVLQRLACPHLPPNPDELGRAVPGKPFNPYITVDFMERARAFYGAEVGVASTDTPPAPDSLGERYATGRKEPFAADANLLKPQKPQPPLAGQPQHSFFQHNVHDGVPGPNWRVPPREGYEPFHWLLHADRPLVSPAELLHVSAFKPHELTQQFVLGGGTARGTPYGHRAPWLDEDLPEDPAGASPPQTHRLYRALEFFATHGLASGATTAPATAGTRPVPSAGTFPPQGPFPNQPVMPLATSGFTATGGTWQLVPGDSVVIDRGRPAEEVVRLRADPNGPPSQFLADFLKPHALNYTITPLVVSERVPGKININTVWDRDTLRALCDGQVAGNRNGSGNTFTEAQVDRVFDLLITSGSNNDYARTKGPAGVPGPDDRPFRGLATGLYPPDDRQFRTTPNTGINDTLLRARLPRRPERLFEAPGDHPYRRFEMLTKVFNQVTTRSNVFAVWVTVGFFEVTDDTTRPVKLGAEIGRAENRQVRHRLFAVVDRSLLVRNPGPQPRFDPRAVPSPGVALGGGRVVPYFSIIE